MTNDYSYHDIVVEAMSRAIFVVAWADREEELKISQMYPYIDFCI